jgi:hypothetical protein
MTNAVATELLRRTRAMVTRKCRAAGNFALFEELLGEALLRAVAAERRFDPTRGASLMTFMEINARGGMLDALKALHVPMLSLDAMAPRRCSYSIEADLNTGLDIARLPQLLAQQREHRRTGPSRGGKTTAACRSPEERRAIALRANEVRWARVRAATQQKEQFVCVKGGKD